MSRVRSISEVYEDEIPETGNQFRRKTRGDFSSLGGMDRRRKQAIMASMKEQKKFPRAMWGTSHSLRGTPSNLAKYGASYRSADAVQKSMRSSKGYSGRGLYTGKGGFWGDIGGKIGDLFGGGHGDLGKAGRGIGSIGDALMGRYGGKGLYTGKGAFVGSDVTNTNNLITGPIPGHVSNSMPVMNSRVLDESGAISISHREYVSDVYAPGTIGSPAVNFSNSGYALNPGLQTSFVFLSQIAQNFDEYSFERVIYHYRSTTTDIGTNTNGQCGTVIMSTNYNAAAPVFTDKQAMVEYAHSHSCKVTEHMSHGVECDPMKSALGGALFVRTGPLTAGQDLKTYDHGQFQIAIANCPLAFNGLPIGELWVEYHVVLRKPKLFTSRGLEIDQDLFFYSGLTTGSTASDSSCLNPMGKSAFGSSVNAKFGQLNGIGCAILTQGSTQVNYTGVAPYNVVVVPSGQIHVVFPATYTGALRVSLYYSGGPSGLVVPSSAFVPTYQGNVVGLGDMGPTSGSTGSIERFGSLPAGLTGTTVTSPVMYFEVHVYVKQSTGGINNVLIMTIPIGNVDNTGGQCGLCVSQIQSQGITNSSQRPVYVNLNGTICQPL